MVTFALLVIFAAAFILFAQDMSQFFKKMYGIYWVRLLAPLFVVSWIWIWHDELLAVLLLWLKERIVLATLGPVHLLPKGFEFIGQGVMLFIIASIPAWVTYGYLRYQNKKLTSDNRLLIARVYAFVWLILAVLVLV